LLARTTPTTFFAVKPRIESGKIHTTLERNFLAVVNAE